MNKNFISEKEIEIKFNNNYSNIKTENTNCILLCNFLQFFTKYKNKKINPSEKIIKKIKIIDLKNEKNILITRINKISINLENLEKQIKKYKNKNNSFINSNLIKLLSNNYTRNIEKLNEYSKRLDQINIILEE